MQSTLPMIVSRLLPQFPLLIVYVVAIVLALVRWQRHPRASAFLLMGAGLLLANSIGWSVAYQVVMSSQAVGSGPMTLGRVFSIMGIVSGLIAAVGHGLMVAAVFAGRDRESSGFPVHATPPPPPRFR